MFQSRYAATPLLLLAVLLLQGCHGYRVTVNNPDPTTEYESKTAHSLAWGLVQKPQYVVAENCRDDAIDEVYITSNFGYTLVSFISLGLWAPLDVQWRCAALTESSADEQPL